MHANDPHTDDNLSRLENRLAGWQPTAAGLDADALLYAAGRASARPPQSGFVWPVLAGALTFVSLGLGGWLTVERGERLALAESLHRQNSPKVPDAVANLATNSDDCSPPGYLVVRNIVTQEGLDAWPKPPQNIGPPDPAFSNKPIPQVWRRDGLPD
jgi:hypothetical protein